MAGFLLEQELNLATENRSIALREILSHEGGYSDHSRDPGGATNMGITRKTLARWRGISPWWHLPRAEVKSLKMQEVKAIYKSQYWNRIAANALPGGLDLALFDFAVNSGPARAAKTLQRELNVRKDGVVGPITLSALAKKTTRVGLAQIIRAVCKARLGFLMRLSTFATFGRGWKKRVDAVERASLDLAGVSQNYQRKQRKPIMDILSGYKTYLMGVFMLVAGIGQLLGVDMPGFDGHSAGNLIVEALAIIFLRKGLKSEIGNA